MNVVAFARPLYVPSGAPDANGAVLVDPRRFLVDNASVAFSSYQLLCFVASFELLIVVLRSAVYFVDVRSPVDVALLADDAVTAPVFLFLLLTLRPDSSSEEEYSESLSETGGGVAARFRRLDFPLAVRFLKSATGAAGAWDSVESIVISRTLLFCLEFELSRRWCFGRLQDFPSASTQP